TLLDTNIRSTIKGIVGLPASTTNVMIYAARNLRGLGMICTQWEVFLQHFAISQRLSSVQDALYHDVFKCTDEMDACRKELGKIHHAMLKEPATPEPVPLEGDSARQLRKQRSEERRVGKECRSR